MSIASAQSSIASIVPDAETRYHPCPVQPAIFLDRDNTLIANDGDLGDPAAVRIIDGVGPGLRALREAGYRLVVVTNQAGVARGRFSEEDVDAVHQRIASLVDQQAGRGVAVAANGLIDRFYYCPYHPEATVPEYRRDHPWRKPHPGMILQAARDMGLDLARSWMIGDQERDILAGKAAGCRTILFTKDAELAQRSKPNAAAATFTDAVRVILNHRGPGASAQSPASATPHAASGTAAAHASGPPARPVVAQPGPASAPHPSSAHHATTAPAAPIAPAGHTGPVGRPGETVEGGWQGVRRAIGELTEELRADRLRRSEFRFVTMLAALCQLLALTLAVLGLLQVDTFETFAKWMLGAVVVQVLTLTLLVLDVRG